jgi:hypothetical protein
MSIPSSKDLNAINERMRVVAQQILERPGCNVGENLVACGPAHELLNDSPGCLWITPYQVLHVIQRRREISLLMAERNRFSMI